MYEPSTENLSRIEECLGLSFAISQKEKQPSDSEGLLEKDQRLIDWFRSLPEEKQKAILISQDGPEDVV